MAHTPIDVAEYMVQCLQADGTLYQETVVSEIADRFGDEFVYQNESGNPAITQAVLKEFRRLTEGQVVWARTSRYWRWREERDGPQRMVDE